MEVLSEERIKAENLHGLDLNDRELIFKNLLPEEKFVDRRIHVVEDIAIESESEPEQIDFIEQKYDNNGECNNLILIFFLVINRSNGFNSSMGS